MKNPVPVTIVHCAAAAIGVTVYAATALGQPTVDSAPPPPPAGAVAIQPTNPPPTAAKPQPAASWGTPSATNAAGPLARPSPAPEPKILFSADPVVDGALLAGSLGATVMLTLIIGTGEITPQQISPTFKTSELLFFDRGAVTQHVDPNAGTYSNVGLYAGIGYAVLDPILSGVREKNFNTTLVDGLIYGETISMTAAITNVAKLAVRRPRPIAYIDFEKNIKKNPHYTNTSTDSALSFFSGHASTLGCITGTATYLAFARSPHSVRPWITLLVGTGLTTFVSIERVRAGEHFPSDVIAGSLTGAGVGVMVSHLHRAEESKPKPLWIAWKPTDLGQGGSLILNGMI